MPKYPQELINVRVTDKHEVMNNEKVKEVIAQVESEMDGNGRVLVRPSGTEPLFVLWSRRQLAEECEAL